jgi:hypothetical protein
MTDNTLDDAARALQTRDVLTGSFELRGEEYPLEAAEPTLDELEELEQSIEADGEVEEMRALIDRYLDAPDVDAGTIGVGKLRALFEGMTAAWNNMDNFEEAEEAMPVESGNRRNSRR